MDNMTTTNASQNRHSKWAGKNGPLLKEPLEQKRIQAPLTDDGDEVNIKYAKIAQM